MRIVPLAFLAASLLTGCTVVYSSYSAVSDSAAVTDSSLVGTWVGKNDDNTYDTVTVETAPKGWYRIRQFSASDTTVTKMEGRTSRIGSGLLFDFVGASAAAFADTNENVALLHEQAFLEPHADSLIVLFPNPDTLKARLLSGRLKWGFAILPKGDVLLTDSTPVLARELAGYLKDPHAALSRVALSRVGAQAPTSGR